MEDQGYFNRVVCTASLRHQLPGSGDKNVIFFLVQGRHRSHEKFYDLLLGRKRGRSESPSCTCYFSGVFSSK